MLVEDALQGAAVHLQPSRRLRDVAVALFEDPLDVLPAHPVGCRSITLFWHRTQESRECARIGLLKAGCKFQSRDSQIEQNLQNRAEKAKHQQCDEHFFRLQ